MLSTLAKSLVKDSGATRRNTPVGSRGATACLGTSPVEGSELDPQGSVLAKRTEKTADRGTHLDSQRLPSTETDDGPSNPSAGTERHRVGVGIDTRVGPILKPRKRTVGSISVPELPWKRGQ